MNRIKFFLAIFFCVSNFSVASFAQGMIKIPTEPSHVLQDIDFMAFSFNFKKKDKSGSDLENTKTKTEKKIEKEAKIEETIAEEKIFVLFDYGLATTWITRLKLQKTRSNFVLEDFLIGAYVSAETRNFLKYINLMSKLALYYPLSYKFNKHPQLIAQPLAFAADVTLGPLFRINIRDVVFIKLSPGFHYLFQKSDRFFYSNIGITGLVGVEMPMARQWGVFVNGQASYDWGNFGTNKTVEDYDHVWQYQVSLGVRYTKYGRYDKSYVDMIMNTIKNGKSKDTKKTPKKKSNEAK